MMEEVQHHTLKGQETNISILIWVTSGIEYLTL